MYEPAEMPGATEVRRAERRWIQRIIGYAFYPLIWLVRRLFQTHSGGDPDRDHVETSLIRRALRDDRPVLGICRGMQLINVVLGGSLHASLAGFHVETPATRSVLPVKRVLVRGGSLLRRILGSEEVMVNALHAQGVRELGEGLFVSGLERSGVIQAIEATDGWCIGVQWHPEYLPQKRTQQRLFRELVREASAQRGSLNRKPR